MQAFHLFIREARKSLGFSTAKDFFRAKQTELAMSYESYANLEAGKYLPPSEKLSALSQALEIENLKAFIFSYCQTMMPNELFKSFFSEQGTGAPSYVLKSNTYADYKEKFQALLKFNQVQTKYELSEEQIAYIEKDLVAWDVINLFVINHDEGYSTAEIAKKTSATITETKKRVHELVRLKVLKELPSGNFLATQDAFILPRRPSASRLTSLLVRREFDKCFGDKRNRPYTRFRSMSIDPADRDFIEMFIDNFILDSRRFKKESGKTHYLQVLFSDRNDLL